MGRKAKFTSRDREQYKMMLIALLEDNPIIHLACKKVGISRQTFYSWKKQDVDFSDDIDKALKMGYGIINDLGESKLIEAVNRGEGWAIRFLLTHRHEGYTKNSMPVEEEAAPPSVIIIPDNGRMKEYNRRNALNAVKPKKESFYKSRAGRSHLKGKKY